MAFPSQMWDCGGVDSLCSPIHMYKVLLSSAHQGTTDSLLTRWGTGPSLLAHGGIQVVMNGYGSHKTWGTIWSWIYHEVICPSLDPNGSLIKICLLSPRVTLALAARQKRLAQRLPLALRVQSGTLLSTCPQDTSRQARRQVTVCILP